MRLMKKEIKLFDTYEIQGTKLCIDNHLYFDLSKLSFISDEVISTQPVPETTHDNVLTFYFSFLLDGILFEIRDNETYTFNEKEVPPNMNKIYPSIKVFSLRKDILPVFLS